MRPGHKHAPGLGKLNDDLSVVARRHQRRLDRELGGRKRRQQTSKGADLEADDAGQGDSQWNSQQTND